MHTMHSATAHPGYTLPVVRELPRPEVAREVPPERVAGAAAQRELVRASLLGCPLR